MNWFTKGSAFIVCCAALLVAGCGGGDDSASQSGSGASSGERTIIVGIVAKSQSNAVFQIAHRGAKDAAKELAEKYGVKIDLRIETPPDEDAQKQAEAIEALSTSGAHGIAVSASHAGTLKPAIEKAVERGCEVVCFDSDVPGSGRLCYYGTDDMDAGNKVMAELADIMGNKGTIAILAGNQAAPNLQKRRDGVLQELRKQTDMKLLDDGTFYHEETPEKAAETINTAQTTHPSINGWALIGGWPLFTNNALRWTPGDVKVVSVDALPEMIDYLDSGHVQVLLAQDCYGWGYQSVKILLDKVVNDQSPAQERVIAPLERVTRETAGAYREKFRQWTK